MIYNNILEAVGNTPIIKLQKLMNSDCANILVKFEGLNVGGSIKTRTALNMILEAEKERKLKKGSIIVEPTSGNQGIGLALVGAVKGYKTIIIMPDSVSEERRKLIEHYGAKVELIHDDGNIGKCIKNCLKKVQEMACENPNVFVPQQFENINNTLAHEKYTATEILNQVGDCPIHGFCSGIGTGGTITGVGHVLRKKWPNIKIWAVEPEKAAILSGSESIGSHLQMGIGDGIIPDILDKKVIDKILTVSDTDAINTARSLACREGIMCGISSGSNVFAAIALAKELGKGKTVLTILPDTAERYFSTDLFCK